MNSVLLKYNFCWALVAHTFNPMTQEVKAGGSEFEESLIPGQPGYKEKPCLEKQPYIYKI